MYRYKIQDEPMFQLLYQCMKDQIDQKVHPEDNGHYLILRCWHLTEQLNAAGYTSKDIMKGLNAQEKSEDVW